MKGEIQMSGHQFRVSGALLGVMLLSITVSSLIGQRGDGPWESGPMWLGTLTYAIFMVTALVLLAYVGYAVATRGRRTAR